MLGKHRRLKRKKCVMYWFTDFTENWAFQHPWLETVTSSSHCPGNSNIDEV